MKRHSVFGWAAVVAATLLLADLASVHFIGSLQSPKALLDQHPGISAEEWNALMGSPIQQVRDFLVPMWRHNDIILPSLFVVCVGSAVLWRRHAAQQAVQRDGPASGGSTR